MTPTGRIVALSVSGVVAIGVLGILCLSAIEFHQTLLGKERRNRVVLVRNLFDAYHAKFERYPERAEARDGDPRSWRMNLLNDLHAATPHSIAGYEALNSVRFPLSSESPQPRCFGSGNLSVFCVTSVSDGPNWETRKKRARVTANDDAVILIEGDFAKIPKSEWTKPVDLWYSEERVFVGDGSTNMAEIRSLKDVLVLRLNGEIEWINGPLNSEQIRSLCRPVHRKREQ